MRHPRERGSSVSLMRHPANAGPSVGLMRHSASAGIHIGSMRHHRETRRDIPIARPCRRNFLCREFRSMNSAYRAVLSPCIGVCMLDEAGLCLGCHRSSGEIARWSQMNDDERLRLMESVLPERESRSIPKPV